jgi:hypothetical protein
MRRLPKLNAYLLETAAFKIVPSIDKMALTRILVQAALRLGIKV